MSKKNLQVELEKWSYQELFKGKHGDQHLCHVCSVCASAHDEKINTILSNGRAKVEGLLISDTH